MDRGEELWRKAEALTTTCYQRETERMQAEYALKGEILHKEFLTSLDRLFCAGRKVRERQNIQPVQYLGIHYLHSSLNAKTYEYHIALYDETLYMDRHSIGFYWCPKFIFGRADEMVENIAPQLRKRMIRLCDYEIEEYRKMYIGGYLPAALQFFQAAIQGIESLQGFQQLRKIEPFYVLYGEYMGASVRLKTIGGKAEGA